MNLNDIGQHIAQARKRQKLTQSSLATQLGMSRATLSGIENVVGSAHADRILGDAGANRRSSSRQRRDAPAAA